MIDVLRCLLSNDPASSQTIAGLVAYDVGQQQTQFLARYRYWFSKQCMAMDGPTPAMAMILVWLSSPVQLWEPGLHETVPSVAYCVANLHSARPKAIAPR